MEVWCGGLQVNIKKPVVVARSKNIEENKAFL
jgi:hypothetical protein